MDNKQIKTLVLNDALAADDIDRVTKTTIPAATRKLVMRKKLLAGLTSGALILAFASAYPEAASASGTTTPAPLNTPTSNSSASQSAAFVNRQHVAVPIDSSYKLVFDDEFNGSSVDTTKWNVLTSYGMGGGYSKVAFVPANAAVANGFLRLTTSQSTNPSRPYDAGFVFTKKSWTYGYWEARAKMPSNGHGMWPAFWMNNSGSFPEIDILEWLGNLPNTQWMTYHPRNDVTLTGGAGLGTTQTGANYATGTHVYGMLWKPTSIGWYIDGVQVFQLNHGDIYNGVPVDITTVAMSTILNSAVGGWNNNSVDNSTSFPTTFDVDYVHIYSNSPTVAAVTPEAGYGGPGDATGSGSP